MSRAAGVGICAVPSLRLAKAASADALLHPGLRAPCLTLQPGEVCSGRALAAAEACDALLVVGSSLMVWSAFRLAKAAAGARARVAILTAGPTRADELAELKVEARAGEVLARLAAQPELGLPRI